jgi:tetratricopeptide (TPR) repeat protein
VAGRAKSVGCRGRRTHASFHRGVEAGRCQLEEHRPVHPSLGADRQGEAERSTELYREIADDAGRRSDLVVLSRALDSMAINYKIVGDYERALEYNRKALEIFDKHDLPDSKMQGHGSRGRLLLALERLDEAVVELEEALRLARQRANPGAVRRWSENLTVALLYLNRIDEAERLTAESLTVDPSWPYSLANRGVIHETARPARGGAAGLGSGSGESEMPR